MSTPQQTPMRANITRDMDTAKLIKRLRGAAALSQRVLAGRRAELEAACKARYARHVATRKDRTRAVKR